MGRGEYGNRKWKKLAERRRCFAADIITGFGDYMGTPGTPNAVQTLPGVLAFMLLFELVHVETIPTLTLSMEEAISISSLSPEVQSWSICYRKDSTDSLLINLDVDKRFNAGDPTLLERCEQEPSRSEIASKKEDKSWIKWIGSKKEVSAQEDLLTGETSSLEQTDGTWKEWAKEYVGIFNKVAAQPIQHISRTDDPKGGKNILLIDLSDSATVTTESSLYDCLETNSSSQEAHSPEYTRLTNEKPAKWNHIWHFNPPSAEKSRKDPPLSDKQALPTQTWTTQKNPPRQTAKPPQGATGKVTCAMCQEAPWKWWYNPPIPRRQGHRRRQRHRRIGGAIPKCQICQEELTLQGWISGRPYQVDPAERDEADKEFNWSYSWDQGGSYVEC
ncbi:MAG: hypothetical protein Q9187_005661 [Circinaria calcarea]